MKKRIFTSLVLIIYFSLLYGQTNSEKSGFLNKVKFLQSNFLPIKSNPGNLIGLFKKSGVLGEIKISQAVSDLKKEEILDSYTCSETVTTIEKINSEGNISYATAAYSEKNQKYRVVSAFNHYMMVDKDGITYMIGYSIRLTAELISNERNINLGSLFAIGLSAKKGKINGTAKLETIGINSPDIIAISPILGELSEAAINTCSQTMSAIKAKLKDDKGISLSPQIIGIRNNDDKTPITSEEIIQKSKN